VSTRPRTSTRAASRDAFSLRCAVPGAPESEERGPERNPSLTLTLTLARPCVWRRAQRPPPRRSLVGQMRSPLLRAVSVPHGLRPHTRPLRVLVKRWPWRATSFLKAQCSRDGGRQRIGAFGSLEPRERSEEECRDTATAWELQGFWSKRNTDPRTAL
jgi:hypothetical protein